MLNGRLSKKGMAALVELGHPAKFGADIRRTSLRHCPGAVVTGTAVNRGRHPDHTGHLLSVRVTAIPNATRVLRAKFGA